VSPPAPTPPARAQSRFDRASRVVARAAGTPAGLGVAGGVVLAWLASGPLFDFSDTWQLVINTSTTIVTFLMVFLIQATQNRDTAAIQIKLDELIRAKEGAHDALLDLEELSEEDLARIRDRYEELAARARRGLAKGKPDTRAIAIDLGVGEKRPRRGRSRRAPRGRKTS
jgi:low affinity Fe/Cu permease